ncbi:MAG: flagellar basal body L-ring protein FlgH [Bryobacteraceae bacterium]
MRESSTIMIRIAILLALAVALGRAGEKKSPALSPLDQYIQQAAQPAGGSAGGGASAGSLWSSSAPFGDVARDLRASQVNDLVTVLVSERASASATGDTSTSRKAEAKGGISSVFGPVHSRIGDMLKLGSDSALQGQGATTRESALATTLSARVTHVLPNGYLVVEGVKDTMVNSERQMISVRGVVRPADLGPGNVVRSDRLAQLEVRMNGKGVVNDAIRRPFSLYRILLGILPF